MLDLYLMRIHSPFCKHLTCLIFAITSKKTAFGSYVEILFTPVVHVRVEMLFRLPIELHSKVYELVFGTCPCRNPHAFYTSKHQIVLNILLINRQSYAETRVLGFQLHKFDFHRWRGTGIHSCRIFLQRLCQWQLCLIQRLSLRAV
jgi:hypothetical protein